MRTRAPSQKNIGKMESFLLSEIFKGRTLISSSHNNYVHTLQQLYMTVYKLTDSPGDPGGPLAPPSPEKPYDEHISHMIMIT